MKIRGLLVTLIAFVLVSMMAVQTVSAAPETPETFTQTVPLRLVLFHPLPGPDYFVRMESEDGQTVVNALVDKPCLLMLFVTLDALNKYQTFYTMPNLGGGPDGSDTRYLMDSIPRLIVDNRDGLPD